MPKKLSATDKTGKKISIHEITRNPEQQSWSLTPALIAPFHPRGAVVETTVATFALLPGYSRPSTFPTVFRIHVTETANVHFLVAPFDAGMGRIELEAAVSVFAISARDARISALLSLLGIDGALARIPIRNSRQCSTQPSMWRAAAKSRIRRVLLTGT